MSGCGDQCHDAVVGRQHDHGLAAVCGVERLHGVQHLAELDVGVLGGASNVGLGRTVGHGIAGVAAPMKVAASFCAPHMCAALSIAPIVTNIPDQGSRVIISIAASATQVSPPVCPAIAEASVPGKNRLPSSGYIQDGNAVVVP